MGSFYSTNDDIISSHSPHYMVAEYAMLEAMLYLHFPFGASFRHYAE